MFRYKKKIKVLEKGKKVEVREERKKRDVKEGEGEVLTEGGMDSENEIICRNGTTDLFGQRSKTKPFFFLKDWKHCGLFPERIRKEYHDL